MSKEASRGAAVSEETAEQTGCHVQVSNVLSRAPELLLTPEKRRGQEGR